jgi:hypothetical protein
MGQRFNGTAPYRAKVTWVQGEFYWRVRREESALVTDFQGPKGQVLSREQTPDEVTWSIGRRLSTQEVAQAFRLTPPERAHLRSDAAPWSGLVNASWQDWLVRGLVLFIFAVLLGRCTEDRCGAMRQRFGESSLEYQQCLAQQRSSHSSSSGGSFGGFSSGGGGHK